MSSTPNGGQVGGRPSCSFNVEWFPNAMCGRDSTGRHEVAGAEKWAKEASQLGTPFRPGSLPDTFEAMPCIGSSAKAVDGNCLFSVLWPGM